MSDPRNVAHDKKVKQEKEHQPEGATAKASSKKGRRKKAASADDQNPALENSSPENEAAKVQHTPGDLEKSTAVLSKLKEMEFHSRANIETLAGLTLTIEDELKQKEFSEAIGAVYSAQDAFQTKITELITSYEAKMRELEAAGLKA